MSETEGRRKIEANMFSNRSPGAVPPLLRLRACAAAALVVMATRAPASPDERQEASDDVTPRRVADGVARVAAVVGGARRLLLTQ